MGKHLQIYGGGNLKTNIKSYHSLDYYGEDDPHRQAQIAIEGEKFLNPWRMVWSSANNAITQPGTLDILLGDPWGLDSERLAVLWDNNKLVSTLTVEEGSTVMVDVPAINGDVLQIWMTDDNPITVRYISNPKEAEARKKEVAEKKARTWKDAATDAAGDLKDSSSNMKWTIGGLAVIALAGAAIWFSRK